MAFWRRRKGKDPPEAPGADSDEGAPLAERLEPEGPETSETSEDNSYFTATPPPASVIPADDPRPTLPPISVAPDSDRGTLPPRSTLPPSGTPSGGPPRGGGPTVAAWVWRIFFYLFGRLFEGVALVLIFITAMVAAVVLHSNLEPARKVIASGLTELVDTQLRGRIEFIGLENIGPGGFGTREINVYDSHGEKVLTSQDTRIRFGVTSLLWSIITGPGININIAHVRIESAHVELELDEEGELTLADAFTPILVASPDEDPDDSGPAVYLSIPQIELGRATSRIRLPGLPPAWGRVREARASLSVSPERAIVDVPQFGAVIRGIARRRARGTGSVHVEAPGGTTVGFAGFIGDVSVDTEVRIAESFLAVDVSIPRAEPQAMRELLPGWPVQVPVLARLHGEGHLPELKVSGELRAEDQPVQTDGTLKLNPVSLELNLQADAFDLRAFFPDGPATQVPVKGKLELGADENGVRGKATARTGASEIVNIQLPEFDWALTFDENGARGTAKAAGGKVPLTADWRVDSEGAINIDARAPRMAIRDFMPELDVLQGDFAPTAKVRIYDGRITGSASAQLFNFGAGVFHLGVGGLGFNLRGDIDRPLSWQIDGSVHGESAELGPLEFDKATFSAKGRLGHPEVSAALQTVGGATVSANAALDLAPDFQIRDLDVLVKSAKAEIAASANTFMISKGALVATQLKITGAGGEVSGDIKISEESLAIDLTGHDVDLAVVGRALDLPEGTLTGRLNVDADVVTAADELVRGEVHFGLGAGSIGDIRNVSARINASFHHRKFTGSASVYAPKVGSLGAVWDIELADEPSLITAWRDATGSTQVQVNGLDLKRMTELVPSVDWPKMTGLLHAQVDGQRPSAGDFPSVYAFLRTEGLTIETTDEGGEGSRSLLGGADVQLSLGVNGVTGESVVAGVLSGSDKQPLLSASGTIVLDIPKIVEDPSAFSSLILTTPIQVSVQIPERAMNELPYDIIGLGVMGQVAGRASLKGTLLTPDVTAELTLKEFKMRSSRLAFPIDGTVRLAYTQATSELSLKGVLETSGRQVADINVSGRVPWQGIVGGERGQSVDWSAKASATLTGFPLQVIPFFADRKIAGDVDGAITVIQEGSPKATAKLDIENLRVQGLPLGDAEFSVRSNGPKLEMRLEGKAKSGTFVTRLLASVDWQDFPPSFSAGTPIRAEIKASNYDAVILLPVLDQVFAEFHGQFDSDLSVVLEPPSTAGGDWSGGITGTTALKGITAQFEGLGLELTNLSMNATATRTASGTTIDLPDIKATSGDEGKISGSGAVFLKGLAFDHAEAKLTVDQTPMYLEGVNRGTATGDASFKITKNGDHMLVDIQLPKLEAELNRQSPRKVLPLVGNPAIHVLQPTAEPDSSPTGPELDWRLAFHLGNQVLLTRRDLSIPMTGAPVIDLGTKTEVTGYLTLMQGGRFPVLGKTFIIQQGTVSFDTGDISDPRLTVSSSWRAPDATIIYADVSGKLSQLKLTLRSDPPMSQQEVYARLVGGLTTSTRDQYATGPDQEQAPSGTAAIGPGAEILGLNELLAGTPLRRVEILIDTTSEGSQSYTAAFQLTHDIWISMTYLRTDDPSGSGTTSLDSTAYNFVSGAVDWRFLPDYTIRVEFGSAGGAIDLLWQHFY